MRTRTARTVVGTVAVLVGGTALAAPTLPAAAASGDFSINLVASAPYSYDHLVGGGAFDDGTKGKSADIVESLEASDFACGDIVTYLTKVSVDNTTSAGNDGPQTIEVDYQFLMDTTGASGAAIGDIVQVGVNYAPVADLVAGEDTVDQGITDDGGSGASLVSTTRTGPLFTAGSKLLGTVRVSDLDRAEQVVVRVDVRLVCLPGSRPTGNLQGAVTAARLTTVRGTTAVTPPSAIGVGNQTVPFLQFGNLRMPELDIAKTVTGAGGTCPGTESRTVAPGGSVTYCFVVTNPSATTSPPGAALYDVSPITDDNHTPSDPTDDLTVHLSGLSDLDGDGAADDLAAGATATGQVLVPVGTTTGTRTNTATVSGSPFPGDTDYPLTDSDTASVTVAGTPVETPAITTHKSVTDAGGDGVAALDEVLTWTIGVTNTGNTTLTDVRVDDPVLGVLDEACGAGPLAPGESRTCFTRTQVVTAGDLVAGHVTNTATASGQPPTGPRVQDADTAAIPTEVPETGTAELVVDKTADSAWVDAGGSLTWTIEVRNDGEATARDVVVTDVLPVGTTFTSGSAGCTATGQTVTCSLGAVPSGETRTVTVTTEVASYAEDRDAHDHQLGVTKVESHLSLLGGETGTLTTTCPTGMVATDGSVRMDAVDQGTGTFASAFVSASRPTPDGTGWTGVVTNHATGQLQGKVNVVCVSTATVSGEGHTHPLLLTDPADATRAGVPLPVGTTEVAATCPAGTLPVAPGFTLHAGEGVVTTRHPAVETIVFVARMTTPGTGDVSVRCLAPELGEVDGHRHDLTWSELADAATVPAGGTAAPRLTCPDGAKGVTAWADLDGVWMGSDPQPVTREFRFFNPGTVDATATFGLLCLAVRSGGLEADVPLVNTASATTSSPEDDLTDNSDTADVTVRSVSAAPRAQAGRSAVTVRLGALAAQPVRLQLVAARGVPGTGIRRGTTLARETTTLREGMQPVTLTPTPRARDALAAGRIPRARLVVRTEDGERRTVLVRLVRGR